MNTIIQGQLDRVEAALNTLTASIESYNPSVPAAVDLLAADDQLQQGVKLHASSISNLLISIQLANIKQITPTSSASGAQSKNKSSKPSPPSLYSPRPAKVSFPPPRLRFPTIPAMCPSPNCWSTLET
ncbi:MAG: hypothetical protein L6R40_008352 [Gallowayella cf. fulva]|nr:MAG: hypothetical protein L6R40_008352 [Xanthomendoza cf. fulva]